MSKELTEEEQRIIDEVIRDVWSKIEPKIREKCRDYLITGAPVEITLEELQAVLTGTKQEAGEDDVRTQAMLAFVISFTVMLIVGALWLIMSGGA